VDLYEYQGKRLFRQAGLPVPEGWQARSVEEAARLAETRGLPLVVKAQVRSGGRGKAGGVQVCETAAAVTAAVERLLAMRIAGAPVESVLLERVVPIVRELYVAFVLSRHDRCPLLLFSSRGGVDIEMAAHETPTTLVRRSIDPLLGLMDYQVRDVVTAAESAWAAVPGAEWTAETAAGIGAVVRALWALYCASDATLVEVNPLVVTTSGEVVCLDSKVTIDDNALFRQEDLATLCGPGDERERRARAAGLSFVALGGDVGVVGNGAGLVMSALDLIAAAGGRAADFCDVGGGARADRVEEAVSIVLSVPGLRSLLISIFGGITRGDEVAHGLLRALATAGPHVPVVVRLDGNGAAEGRALLAAGASRGLRVADDIDEAVGLAVAAAAPASSAPSVADGIASARGPSRPPDRATGGP
jgi:succinyl-CoA synthetase beta subunit